MLWTISCGCLTAFCVLYAGLLIAAAALWRRDDGRSPAGVVDPGIDRLPGRPDRTANRVLGRLTQIGPGCGPTGVRESDFPGLERSGRQFEEALEKIRLSHQGSRRRGER
jgi:hypothetical protein